MIELLVTIAIIAILASLLLVTLAKAKASGANAKCKSNLRQLSQGMAMYVADEGVYMRGYSAHWAPYANENWLGKFWWGDLFKYCSIPIPRPDYGLHQFPDVMTCPGSPPNPKFRYGDLMGEGDDLKVYANIRGMRHEVYGYNWSGAIATAKIAGLFQVMQFGEVGSGFGLGTECKDDEIASPANMIAMMCRFAVNPSFCVMPLGDPPFGLGAWHTKRLNGVFVDGHVELGRTKDWTNETVRARWNRDGQPHPEAW